MAGALHTTSISRRRPLRRAAAGCLAVLVFSGLWAQGSDESDIAECESIKPGASRSGLIFNPSGKQIYFERSRCFLGVAVESRDARLCERVIERESWFFDGSGISPEACREAVRERIGEDRREAETITDVHQLVSASLGSSSNQRDFTLQLVTAGSHPGTYRVEIELISLKGREDLQVESYLQPLGRSPARLVRHIPREKLDSGAARWQSEAPVRLRITLTLVPSSSDSKWVLAQVDEPLSSSHVIEVETKSRPNDSRGGTGDA